jgi:hypothetical protein
MCVQTYNTCVIAPNDCVPAASNPCVTPATGDVCGPSTAPKKESGTPGPIRMCRASQTVCGSNKDCATGDTCGPATSRMVIAKRAINTVMNSSYEMVNFGLMTFYQGGYYPYYEMVGTTTGTVTEFVTKERLLQVDPVCWGSAWGATPTCTLSGRSMKLRLMQNSRYIVNTGTAFVEVEDNWCGDTCDIKGVGPGIYVGSFYQYDGVQGGNATSSQVLTSYQGKKTPIGGKDFYYYEARPDYYNGGMPPPFTFTNCETTGVCGEHCGGRWDTDLAPFIDTSDDPDVAKANVVKIGERLEKASNGGLMAYWSTPTGCTLQNDSAVAGPSNSAYHYMSTLKTGDSVACRENFILLITDGAANGPGDIDASGKSVCDVAACAEADPEAAGCVCKSVLATYHLRKNLGVKTFVIGFSGDVAAGVPRIINDNMARAGGTDAGGDGAAPYAFLAQSEGELVNAIQMAVFDAVRGSYSTAPTSTSAGTQQATTVAEGRYALDSRMDFPEWKGHLIAYDLGGSSPVIAWDAYTQLATMNWKTRRVYTWDGTNMVKIQVDPSSGAIINKADLAALGLAGSANEAEKVARWALGDPTYKNPAILGAIINSTPIDIAGPGDIPLPGGHDFYVAHKDRPHLVYVGSSDGMLHAFFLEQTTLGSNTYPAGSEAFAFIPPEMLPVIKRLYAQGGQKTDPYHHVFGLADSPKAKSMCVSGCSDPTTAVWKTLLLMPEGYGGRETFMLDVTSPFSSTGVADPPVTVRWHTGYGSSAADYVDYLGNTISLPAFFMNKTSALDDTRVVFASGYATNPSKTNQGRTLITASAASGVIKNHFVLDPTQTALDSTPPAVDPDAPDNSDCGIPYAALTDVATARDFGKDQNNRMLAAYFGDTYGRLWRYTLGSSLSQPAYNFGCGHPLHFSPTIVQLDRDDFNSSHAREIYPVVVTNSNLDLDTTDRVPSQMIFLKEIAQVDKDGNLTGVAQDMTWGNNTGRITLTVGNDAEICGVTHKDSVTKLITCTTSMPLAARPTSTPLGLLRGDASGFQVMTMWYVPAADGCTKGVTYLTIHEMTSGNIDQLLGAAVAQEPVTSPVVLRGRIYLFGSSGAYDITNLASDTVVTTGRAIEPTSLGGNFARFNWTELFE